MFGKRFLEDLSKCRQIFSLQGGDGNDIAKMLHAGEVFDQRKKRLASHRVGFVDSKDKGFRPLFRKDLGLHLIGELHSLRGLGKDEKDVGILERAPRHKEHFFMKEIPRFEEPRSVEKDHLTLFVGGDSEHPLSRRLRFSCNDGNLLLQEGIHEC